GGLAAAVRFAGFRLAVPRRPVRAASGAQDAAFGLRLDRVRPVAMGSPPARLARLQGHSLDPRRILPADAGVFRQQAGSRIHPAYLERKANRPTRGKSTSRLSGRTAGLSASLLGILFQLGNRNAQPQPLPPSPPSQGRAS